MHFRILVALKGEPLHGYRIVKSLEAHATGPVHPANLYRRIRALKKDGLLREAEAPEASPDERERKFFALSPLGWQVLAAETERLQGLLIEAGMVMLVPDES